MTGQFTPLTSFLERANRETVELTFDELEDVLGRPLSKSARTHRAWWANSGHAHAITWTSAGYRVERPDLARGIVRFVRSGGARPETILAGAAGPLGDNPIVSAFAPWRNPRSRWPVEHHLAALDQDFEQCFSVCAQRRIFSGPSVHFYERTIDIVRHARSPDALAENPAFYDLVYATLTSWGMHRMGEKVSAKLTEFDTFSKTLRGLLGAVDDLYGLSILDLDDERAAALGAQIGQLAATEGVTASKAPLVANTKTLHFILPDLLPPMDRTYTGRFFFGPNTGLLLPGPTSDTVEYMFGALHRLARRHAQFLRDVTGTYLCLGHAKGLDNATIGYVLTHPRAFPRAGRRGTAEPE